MLKCRDGRLREILSKMQEKSLCSPTESPMFSFLHREMVGALDLISKVHRDLGVLAKFLLKSRVLPQKLDGMIRSLLRGETPVEWLVLWRTGPEDCPTFLTSVIAKTQALKVL